VSWLRLATTVVPVTVVPMAVGSPAVGIVRAAGRAVRARGAPSVPSGQGRTRASEASSSSGAAGASAGASSSRDPGPEPDRRALCATYSGSRGSPPRTSSAFTCQPGLQPPAAGPPSSRKVSQRRDRPTGCHGMTASPARHWPKRTVEEELSAASLFPALTLPFIAGIHGAQGSRSPGRPRWTPGQAGQPAERPRVGARSSSTGRFRRSADQRPSPSRSP